MTHAVSTSSRWTGRAAAWAAGCLLVSACATQPQAPGHETPLATRAESGLGLVGPETPARLRAIALAPYVAPDPMDCANLGREIAALDEVLGPDVDAKVVPADNGQKMQRAAGDALVGLVPYRGVVRWVSGAGRQERERAHAVLAGAARRGFLKGLSLAHACGAAEAK